MNEVYVILILCVLYYQRQLCGGSAQKICWSKANERSLCYSYSVCSVLPAAVVWRERTENWEKRIIRNIHFIETWTKIKFISVFNQVDAQNLFQNKFYFMSLHVSSTCAHHQEVKIALHSLWYQVWWYKRLCIAILTSWWWAHVLETCRDMK